MIFNHLQLHREFLNHQFESFMEYLLQNGGQIIQLSKNGQDETGMFLPLKRDKRGGAAGSPNGDADGSPGEEEEDDDDDDGGQDAKQEGDEDRDEKDRRGDGAEDGEELDPLPPPQAILGSPAGDLSSEENLESNNKETVSRNRQNGPARQDAEAGHSRRSSHNVVSSSDVNGDLEFEEVDSSQEYDSNDMSVPPEMMKYDMNHFMFSHFLDEMNGGGDDNGMDESYNEDDMGMYDGEDEMSMVGSSRPLPTSRQALPQWSKNNSRLGSAMLPHAPKGIPPPVTGAPHNERTCRYCGKTFHWKQSWVIHERTHTGEKPYLCKCGKAFSQKSNMNTHAKSCGQAMTAQKGKTTVFQMKCSHCQKMFTHKKNLDLHMEKFHPEVLNLSVKGSSGGGASSSPTSSQYHNGTGALDLELSTAAAQRAVENAAILQILKTASSQVTKSLGSLSPSSLSNALGHRSSSANSDNNSGMNDERTGRYPCPYCPKRFPVKGTLERHLRVHTGEKPFLCGICGKAFTQKGSVKLHLERVHRQTM